GVAMRPAGPHHPINSRAWWEEYFLHHWDANHGSAQTAHFMDRLLAGLRRQGREYDYLAAHPLDLLDWGCAFGEGAQRLAHALPNCRVAGLDFAEEAVRVPRRRFPARQLLRTDGGRIPRALDLIRPSNCPAPS